MKRHIEVVQEKIRSHVCGDCGYAAAQLRVLMWHKESVHNMGENTFACELCSYKAYKEESFRIHVKTVHGM